MLPPKKTNPKQKKKPQNKLQHKLQSELNIHFGNMKNHLEPEIQKFKNRNKQTKKRNRKKWEGNKLNPGKKIGVKDKNYHRSEE